MNDGIIRVDARTKLLRDNARIPCYADDFAAGCDFFAAIDEPITIEPGTKAEIPFGLIIEIPVGYKLTVRSRSGLFLKHDIEVYAGLIDSNYRGELSAFLINRGTEPYTVHPNDRVAQGEIEPLYRLNVIVSDELTKTERGDKGFGSTGV